MNKRFSLTFTFFIFLSFFLLTQDSIAAQWARTYGGDTTSETAHSIQQTSDGGYIVAGVIGPYPPGDTAILISKLGQTGAVTWQKSYGGGSYPHEARSIQQTSDGGYIVAGTKNIGYQSSDIWVFKLDQAGNISWQKTYGGSYADSAHSIQQTTDGGYIVAGWYSNWLRFEVWVLKLDQAGNVSWQKTYSGGNDHDLVYSIQQTTDGGYILAGQTWPAGGPGPGMWVLKLDQTGTVAWEATYGTTYPSCSYSIQQTNDGGYLVAGSTSTASYDDVRILKLDQTGTVSWQKKCGAGGNDRANSIRQTTDGGYIMAGTTSSSGSAPPDAWILKLDHEGSVSWQKIYGGNGGDYAYSIQQTTDGGYIVAGSAGSTSPDMWILKLDSNGNIGNCSIASTSNITVSDSNVPIDHTAVLVESPSYNTNNTTVTPQTITSDMETQCFFCDWYPTAPPSQERLNGVWGYLATDPTPTHQFYAVGEYGVVFHYDGDEWFAMESGTNQHLNGIWGISGTDIFAVGDNATIVRYTGSWTNMTHSLPTVNLKDVWGSSANDVFVVGEGGFIAHYDGSGWSQVTSPTSAKLTGIWGNASNNYVAVGEGGAVIEYNGSSWEDLESRPTSNDLSEVWGSSGTDIFAVGESGTIIHYNDSSWAEITSPTSANLRGIWGSSADNIFAVGEYGSILYYNGTSWTKMDTGTQDSLISTFGTFNPRVMVVGYDGNILSFTGPSVQGRICNACTGAAINNVFVELDKNLPPYQTAHTNYQGIYPPLQSQAGEHPLLFTVSGYLSQEPTVINLPNNPSLIDHATYLLPNPGYQNCISGTVTKTVSIGNPPRANDRGVQNMQLKLFQGTTLKATSTTDAGGNYHFTGLSSGSNYKIKPTVTTSECTTTPIEYTGIPVPTTSQYSFTIDCPTTPPDAGAYWVALESGTTRLLHGIWGSSSDNIFAVGDGGTIIHYDGTWDPQTSGTENNLKGVWGSSADTVYAVGAGGIVLKTINRGTNWTATTISTNGLNAIWGSSASNIFAVGDFGTIIRYNGSSWTPMYSGTTVKLLGVFGTSGTDVFAVGNSHMDDYWKRTVLHYNGISWSTEDIGNGVTLMSSWGESSTDITAAGSFGGILRYDGTDWQQTGGPTESTLNAMWGESATDIFAVGYAGTIAHYDGTNWSVRKTASGNDLYGIWGASSTELFAVGDNGTILAYSEDVDGDGAPNITDNCPEIANANQANSDGDFRGDLCDNCPTITNENQANSDADSLGNACDNCWFVSNTSQADSDFDCPALPYTADPKCGDSCEFTGSDTDGDGIINEEDNCPTRANPFQEDSYPPQTNGIGDACECEGDFLCDGDVDADDVTAFLADFGREPSWRACGHPTWGACDGDFECDGDVDADDVSKFLEDFGREPSFKPCPTCVAGAWCSYP